MAPDTGPEHGFDTDTERSLDEQTGGLVSQLLLASARQVQGTMDSIQKITEDQRDDMARAYLKLYDAFEAIPEMTRSAYIDRVLYSHAHNRDHAERLVNPGSY